MKDLLKSIAVAWISPKGVFYASLTVLLWMAGPKMILHINNILVRGEAVETKINATAVNLDHATKTWATASQAQAQSVQVLVGKLSGTADNLNDEISTFRKTTDSLNQLVENANPVLVSAKTAIDSLPPAIKSTQDTITSLQKPIDDSSHLISDVDKRVSDPHVQVLMENLSGISVSGNHMLQTADQVETKATKGYLHPSHNPFKKIFGPIVPILIAGAKIASSIL